MCLEAEVVIFFFKLCLQREMFILLFCVIMIIKEVNYISDFALHCAATKQCQSCCGFFHKDAHAISKTEPNE